MMSPDDEPQIQPSKNIKNNLINEAFNLNSNFTGLQPLTVLPPSSSHFKPITHSRTPSMEIKDLKLSALKPPPVNLFQNSQSKTPNSFFDQPNSTPSNILAQPTQKTPDPTEIKRNNSAVSLNHFNSSVSSSGTNNSPLPSTIPPPVQPLIQPPAAMPPQQSSSANGTSNPYAAKGALNRKVYDKVINVAPITQPADFLTASPASNQSTILENSMSGNSLPQSHSAQNFFMPPVPIQNPTTMPASQSYQFPTSSEHPPNFESNLGPMNMNNNNTQLTNSYQQPNQTNTNNSNSQSNSGYWNWFSQSKLVNTFVEKAKIGVETFVTTVDPQMSNYNHPANRPLYLLSSMTTPKVVHTIREAFNNTGFSKISMNSIDAQNSSQFAPQIIGFPCALQSAREKLENSFNVMQDAECTVIAMQDFIAELTTDCWFELAVIMLKDKRKNIELTVYTEATPVPSSDISQLQQYTPNDFNLKWSGLACRLPEKNFNFNASNGSNSPFLAYETMDTMLSNERLSHALKTLANLFKNKMLSQIN